MTKQQPKDRLPTTIDPRKLAHQGILLKGTLPLSQTVRLKEAVLFDEDVLINTSLQLGVDIERHMTVTGVVSTTVSVPCERCLQPMSVDLEAKVSLAIVWTDEEAKRLPSHLEPLICGEGKMPTTELIEDELLLALPFVSYHSEEECQLSYQLDIELEEDGDSTDSEQENPFSILEQLKGKLSE